MATSVISNTVTDPAGTAVAGVRVVARLVPPPCFRTADGSEIDPVVETVTDGSGVWSLTLEETAGISPSGSHYEVVEYLPSKPRTHTIQVGASNQSLFAALVTPPPAADGNTYLTQVSADARYQALSALGGTAEDVDLAAGSNGVATSAARSDHKHALASGYRLPYVGSSAPSDPGAGDLWTHSSTLRVCVFDGTGWRVIDEDWQDFTPAFTNFTLGNGTVTRAAYKRQGTSLSLNVDVTLGSTSSVSGNLGINLPINYASGGFTGAVMLNDNGTRYYPGVAHLSTNVLYLIHTESGNTGLANATTPFTWTTNDQFKVAVAYPISVASARVS